MYFLPRKRKSQSYFYKSSKSSWRWWKKWYNPRELSLRVDFLCRLFSTCLSAYKNSGVVWKVPRKSKTYKLNLPQIWCLHVTFHIIERHRALSKTDRPNHSRTSDFDNDKCFFQEFLLKHHRYRACYLGFHWSGWIVLIKSEILIVTGLVCPVSSDKWKAPLESRLQQTANVRFKLRINFSKEKTCSYRT